MKKVGLDQEIFSKFLFETFWKRIGSSSHAGGSGSQPAQEQSAEIVQHVESPKPLTAGQCVMHEINGPADSRVWRSRQRLRVSRGQALLAFVQKIHLKKTIYSVTRLWGKRSCAGGPNISAASLIIRGDFCQKMHF